MKKISVFGSSGFVLGNFCAMYPDDVVKISRDGIFALTKDILYGISTVHNYHPKDGNPFLDIETNLMHFMKVLHANKNDAGVFNLISTWFVYGKNCKLPASEDDLCNPTGFYSVTSLAREGLLKSYCETFGIKYRILRLVNVIGIGDKKISRKKNALQHMVRELAQSRDVDYLYKEGAIRDFIDVRDCAKAIKLVIERGNANEIYNIGNGQGYNINDLVDVAHRASGYKSKLTTIDTPQFHKVVQTPKFFADTKKLKSLGYVKEHDIKTSVEELVAYYEKNEI